MMYEKANLKLGHIKIAILHMFKVASDVHKELGYRLSGVNEDD